MAAQSAGVLPVDAMLLPPARMEPYWLVVTSESAGSTAATICAAFWARVIVARRDAVRIWHSALGQITDPSLVTTVPPLPASSPPPPSLLLPAPEELLLQAEADANPTTTPAPTSATNSLRLHALLGSPVARWVLILLAFLM